MARSTRCLRHAGERPPPLHVASVRAWHLRSGRAAGRVVCGWAAPAGGRARDTAYVFVGTPRADYGRCEQRPDRITITFPVHPLVGAEVVLIRIERWPRYGRRYAIVEHPRGGTVRLPAEWTDALRAGCRRAKRAPRSAVDRRAAEATTRRCRRWIERWPTTADPHGRIPGGSRTAGADGAKSARVDWASLPAEARRDVLGAWASLLRKMVRSPTNDAEAADEREDPAQSPGATRGGLSAPVDAQAGARASRVDRAPIRAAATRRGSGLG